MLGTGLAMQMKIWREVDEPDYGKGPGAFITQNILPRVRSACSMSPLTGKRVKGETEKRLP